LFKAHRLSGAPSDSFKARIKSWRWQLLSLVLTAVLAVSLGFGVYQSLNAYKASGGNSSNNQSDTLLDSTSTANGTWLNFTFTWSPESQKIVQGEFRLKIGMCFYTHYSTYYGFTEKRVRMLIEANDDGGCYYVGLVFDTNQNGHIDTDDQAYALFANNMTIPEAFLTEEGFLVFAQMPETLGPQRVSFNPDTGHTFSIDFAARFVSYRYNHIEPINWDPVQLLKKDATTLYMSATSMQAVNTCSLDFLLTFRRSSDERNFQPFLDPLHKHPQLVFIIEGCNKIKL
jgi:hypothetical protein